MNLPNKLTISRVVLIPIYMIFAFPVPKFLADVEFFAKYRIIFALFIFIIASITDTLDGNIARKYNLVTDFGKFLDPIADKLLVTVALLAIAQINPYYSWATMIILTREFAVTGMRLIAASKGKVIAAGVSGKIKTVTQLVALITLQTAWAADLAFANVKIITDIANILYIAGNIVLILAVIITIYSGIEYFAKNKDLFAHSK